MDKQEEHLNSWAKKLEDAKTPEQDEWSSMEKLLNKNMPNAKKDNRRYWLLTTVFLLLLIGVCNWPGLDKKERNITGKNNSLISDTTSNCANHTLTSDNISRQMDGGVKSNENTTWNGASNTLQSESAYSHYIQKEEKSVPVKSNSTISKKTSPIINNDQAPAISQKSTIENKRSEFTDSAKRNNDLSKADKTNSLVPLKNKKPSNKELPPSDKKNKVSEPDYDLKGFAITIGLNQFFPVGTQDKSNYNSNGTTGGISDYIPVPGGRYYFHKWLYLETELQINSPQFTQSLLIDQKKESNATQPLIQSVFLTKLFYFNIPLSLHYSPVRNLFVGAGIQFSRLTNGVALYQSTNLSSGYINNAVNQHDSSLVYSEVKNFKNDTGYQKIKTNEWRFLVELNYQWKRLTIGARYNQAFNDFVHVQVPSGTITQAHNSSLQIFLQYMLWDNRKKITQPSHQK